MRGAPLEIPGIYWLAESCRFGKEVAPNPPCASCARGELSTRSQPGQGKPLGLGKQGNAFRAFLVDGHEWKMVPTRTIQEWLWNSSRESSGAGSSSLRWCHTQLCCSGALENAARAGKRWGKRLQQHEQAAPSAADRAVSGAVLCSPGGAGEKHPELRPLRAQRCGQG